MKRVLLVSKPVVPPWSDSSKNLVRDLALGIDRYQLHLMGNGQCPFERANVTWENVYSGAGSYAPSARQNARALWRVARPDRGIDLYHFFFAPNPTTSRILGPLMRAKRARSVHTVCSVPRSLDEVRRLLFADRVVAVSDHTADALQRAGVPGVRRIYPCIDPDRLRHDGENPLARELGVTGVPVVLYAGDLELPGMPELLVALLAQLRRLPTRAHLVIAARNKTAETRAAREALVTAATSAGLADGLSMLAEVAHVDQLLALTDVAVLPVPTLYRKMDIPLVLLEAMGREIPIVVSDLPPLVELTRDGGGAVVPVGDAGALGQRVGELLVDPDRRTRMGRAARRRVLAEFSIPCATRAYERVYEEILDEPDER